MDELFVDGSNPEAEKNGSNRTGIYDLKTKLTKDILPLLPILMKIIKINYPTILRLCTNCFKSHCKKLSFEESFMIGLCVQFYNHEQKHSQSSSGK